jgi:hypothetical protein
MGDYGKIKGAGRGATIMYGIWHGLFDIRVLQCYTNRVSNTASPGGVFNMFPDSSTVERLTVNQ